jgi:hypothetical protein
MHTTHEGPGAGRLTIEGRARKIETRVFFLEALQHQFLVDFLFRKHVKLTVTLERCRPRFSFMSFLELDVQLTIFYHPKRRICLHEAESVLIQKRRITFYSDFQVSRLNLNVEVVFRNPWWRFNVYVALV